MQKPGSTSQEPDANAFNCLEGSRIGLTSKMDNKTHHCIGRLRARKGAAGVAIYAPFYPAGARVPWEISDDMVLADLGVSTSIWSAADRLPGLGVAARPGPRAYLAGREPVMRMSTSLLALCCQSGLVATLATPISARSRSIGSRSLRMSPLFIARFTSVRSASWIRA